MAYIKDCLSTGSVLYRTDGTIGSETISNTNINSYSKYISDYPTYAGTSTGTSTGFDCDASWIKSLKSLIDFSNKQYKDFSTVYLSQPVISDDTFLNKYLRNETTTHNYFNINKYLYIPVNGYGYFTDYVNSGQVQSKRSRISSGLSVSIITRGNPFDQKPKENEEVAIETLREEISEKELRRYLRYGFILVKGQSGNTYQVFRNSWHTKVWRGGNLIEEVCVRISKSSKVPSTDNIIAFKHMIEANEESFKKCGNVYNLRRKAA